MEKRFSSNLTLGSGLEDRIARSALASGGGWWGVGLANAGWETEIWGWREGETSVGHNAIESTIQSIYFI